MSALAFLFAAIVGKERDCSCVPAIMIMSSIVMSESVPGQDSLLVKVENLPEKEYDRHNQEMKVRLRALLNHSLHTFYRHYRARL